MIEREPGGGRIQCSGNSGAVGSAPAYRARPATLGEQPPDLAGRVAGSTGGGHPAVPHGPSALVLDQVVVAQVIALLPFLGMSSASVQLDPPPQVADIPVATATLVALATVPLALRESMGELDVVAVAPLEGRLDAVDDVTKSGPRRRTSGMAPGCEVTRLVDRHARPGATMAAPMWHAYLNHAGQV